jgi:hypothetical protein
MGDVPMPGAFNAFEMAAVAQKISSDLKEYLLIVETERTKRLEIKSSYQAEVKRIDALRGVFETFLDRSFEERQKNFEELFRIIRKSMEKNDLHTLEITLAAAVEIAKVSPLAEAKSLGAFREAMNNPDHEFTI